MTVPRWRPHQVRQHLNLRAQDTRILQTIRNTPPPPDVGPGSSAPTFAAATFHWQTAAGDITNAVSDGRTVRWQCSLVAVSIDVTTWSTNFAITMYINGSPVPGLDPTANITGTGNWRFLCNPVTLTPYVDVLTIAATTPGTGNQGVFVSAEVV